MNLHDLIKAIQANQDPALHPFTETLLCVLDNAAEAGEKAGIRIERIDALQAIQIGVAALIEAAVCAQSMQEADE
jgi:putative N-acetylmannosamine-6-phosphate epimerase